MKRKIKQLKKRLPNLLKLKPRLRIKQEWIDLTHMMDSYIIKMAQ